MEVDVEVAGPAETDGMHSVSRGSGTAACAIFALWRQNSKCCIAWVWFIERTPTLAYS